jgi:hypothetical protein
MMPKAKFYACGICDHCHLWDWHGDCRRDDANRFTCQQLEEKYGEDGFELRTMEERVAGDRAGM